MYNTNLEDELQFIFVNFYIYYNSVNTLWLFFDSATIFLYG